MKVSHDDHANIYIEIDPTRIVNTEGGMGIVLTTSEAAELIKLLEHHIRRGDGPMSKLRSTMGAPLNDSEETHITFTWTMLRDALENTLPVEPTPSEMLELAAEIIGRAHKLQMVIHDCWSAANKRCYPENAARKRSAIHSAAADLAALGISPTDLVDALKTMTTQASLREEPSE